MKIIRNLFLFILVYILWCQVSPGNFVQDFVTLRDYAPDFDGEKLLSLARIMMIGGK